MLEDNQVLVQGMMANRYMATFRDPITSWNKKLMAVADVVQLLVEIQRTWAYLESLFIGSEEVTRQWGVFPNSGTPCQVLPGGPSAAAHARSSQRRPQCSAAAAPLISRPSPLGSPHSPLQVKRELPDATQRFARIDTDIKGVLRVRACPWRGPGSGADPCAAGPCVRSLGVRAAEAEYSAAWVAP